jgi:hypothetical protein
MSATLDAGKFQTYFDGAPLLKVTIIFISPMLYLQQARLLASGLYIRSVLF